MHHNLQCNSLKLVKLLADVYLQVILNNLYVTADSFLALFLSL